MKLNRKGFTLVELLVTIVIVGLVVGLSTIGIIHLIKNSKDKVIVLSENNLKEAARIYSSEASSDSWKKNDDSDVFCVTIGELMNKGLLDEKAKINGNLTRNNFIIVKRNKVTLAVNKEEIVKDNIGEENNNICTGQENKNEDITAPQISGFNSYTDRIEISFNPGNTKDEDSAIDGYRCLYGVTSSNINREGTITGNKCILSGLEKNSYYYVHIYMNTKKGSSVLATGDSEYKTKDFVLPGITQNKNTVTITYNDTNIYNNASHYFNSTVEGISSSNVEKCILKNNKFTCSDGTNNIENNTWYRVSESSVSITYAEKDNDIDVTARIVDGSNNYGEDTKKIKIRKYAVKFYKNKASSIDGDTSDYVEKYCISDGSSTCSVTAPSIIAGKGYDVVGYNTSASATTSTWNVNTSKEINGDLSYYAIVKPIVYAITYDLDGGSVSENPTSYTVESNDITLIAPTRTGYTFTGWTGSNGTTPSTAVKITKGSTGDKSYTANWRINKVIINYNVNGGTVTASTTSDEGDEYNWTTKDGLIYLNDSLYSTSKNYGTTASVGLNNYNNSKALKITRNGYSAVSDKEWKCLSGPCKQDTYDQTVDYDASDICDASNGDCTIVVGVNWEENSVTTTINANRFSCQDTDRLAVLYVTTCTETSAGTTCNYTKKNGLSSSYSFSMDVIGTPTWTVNSSNFVSNVKDKTSITTNSKKCSRKLQYVTASYLNCRSSATTKDSNGNDIDNVVNGWDKCTAINTYRTTLKFDSSNNWWYSSTHNCYLSGAHLSTTKPSSCSSSSGGTSSGGGTTGSGTGSTECTTASCKCKAKCGSAVSCYKNNWCYCCADNNTPCKVGGGAQACDAYLM